MDSKSHYNSWVSNIATSSAVFLAGITSLLYVLGLSFHQGYLSYWGINSSLFPLSIDAALFSGFIVGILSLATVAKLLFILIASLVMFFLSAVLYKKKRHWFAWIENQLIQTNNIESSEASEGNFLQSGVRYTSLAVAGVYFFIIFLLVCVVLTLGSNHLGQQHARGVNQKYQSKQDHRTPGNYSLMQHYCFSEDGSCVFGFSVECNRNNFCAIYTGKNIWLGHVKKAYIKQFSP